ncbi:MAG: histidine kinase [Bacteroidetes bacterium]|nr:histidine kinase [Bacteroidota bacterium]
MMWLLRFLLIVIMAGVDFDLFMADEKLEWYKIGFVVASIFSVSFHIISHVRQREKRLVAEQTFLAGTASAELNALKSQLDPHFLFNSLNVLAGLIEENPEKAQDFTVGLSKVYRYVLEQKDKEWVSAQEELNFAKSYLQLMQMRFENSLVVDLPDSLSDTHWRMAPLTLQLLLENAVKHNEAGNRKPLYIRVYESEGKLVVENNFQPRENLGVSTGKGLQNIRQRYGLLTDQPIEVSQNNQKFKVSIPLLIQKKSNMKTTEMNQSYLNARKRLDDLKEFYGSLTSYIIVIPILIFINYRTFWGFQWFWFPMLGWGIGLAFQAAKVYFPNSNWEERKLKQFMDEERRKMM